MEYDSVKCMSSKPLRILMITPFFSPNIGGVETHLDDLCRYLQKRGHKVFVITYQPLTTNVKAPKFERRQNLEIRRFWWIGFNLFHKFESFPILNFIYLVPNLLFHSISFLAQYKNQIDVIHAHGICSAFIALILKKIFKKRAVVSILAIYDFKKRKFLASITSRILNSLDKIIVESEKSKKEIIEIGIPKEKVVVFTEWVDTDRFKPRDKNECKRRLGWDNKFIVLFVGRAIPIKGAATLLEVAKKVDKRIHFAFVSDAGPQVNLLKEAAQREENVIFVGRVDYKDLHWYYNAADVFIIPSQYEEDYARVVVEAISSGTPVIASNRGAIPSIVDPSVSIVLDPNEKEIKEAVEYLFYNRDELERLAKNCRPYALKKFSDENAKVILDCYYEK
jgi:glycosyltransferase involved in cell wall biosynthesis